MRSNKQDVLGKDEIWFAREVVCEISDYVAQYRKNLTVLKLSDHLNMEHSIHFTIMYDPSNDRGLPSKEDDSAINEFEEVYIPKLADESGAIYVASAQSNGFKNLLFYVKDPRSFFESLELNESKLRSFKVESDYDPKWQAYQDFLTLDSKAEC